MSEVIDEAVRLCILKRDAMLVERLRELGPGWAVGWRLKTDTFSTGCWHASHENPKVTFEWEFHAIELVDGALPAALAEFTYVTLKDPK